jgi:hypothetical protein
MSVAALGLILNIVIAGLLVANIAYCWVLNKRIKILQDGKSELANLLQYFDEATERASESIVALQTASKKIGESMQGKIDKANFLMDDLAFMVEKGNAVADRLDANFTVNKVRTRVLSDGSDDDREEFMPEKAVARPAYVTENKPAPRIVDNRNLNKEKTAASLEAVLGRMVGRKPANVAGNNTQSVDNVTPEKESPSSKTPSKSRSKAEQELLEMIRGGIKG